MSHDKPRKASPVLIGTFVLGALALLAFAIIVLGGAALFTPKQRAVIFLEGNVKGLAVGSPVNFRGVRIGEVDRIALHIDAATLNARIAVYITLLPKQVRTLGGGGNDVHDIPFDSFIAKGLRAKLAMQSIVTGQLGVDLDFRPDVPALLLGSPEADIPEIPGIKSDFDVLKDQLSQIPFRQLSDNVKSLVASISVLTGSTDKTLGVFGDEMKATAASARKTLDTATATLVSMQATLRSVQHTSDQAGATLATLSPALQETLKSADAAMKRAESTLANADATLAQTAELTAPGAPLRADLEQSLRDLSASAESLRDFASSVERRPNSLIFGKD